MHERRTHTHIHTTHTHTHTHTESCTTDATEIAQRCNRKNWTQVLCMYTTDAEQSDVSVRIESKLRQRSAD